ncbi:nuclear envelope pore membrane protein POM 121 isoform X1 [Syngnathus typhle]|uniref:nuclear envelope pore membrane protein POM 121 isoform X1 n=1 Tax=Syngnathus typhle TaxID=161592 RepID=UPI002A6B52EE|nr:nuclear envelope pore membrane protein POM 121 isoform X1 [Syngnathus typhle]
MSPRERNVVLLSGLGIVGLSLYFFPSCLYIVATLVVCGGAFVLRRGTPLPARFGLNPRTGFSAPAGYLRRFWDWWLSDVSVVSRRTTLDVCRRDPRGSSLGAFRQRQAGAAIHRVGHIASNACLFSPGDVLMGSYIGKPESPTGDFGMPRVVREQLREMLSRPNHAVCTPNRRLSFTRETSGTVGHFTITPQRHYPLQQPGASPVGVLPPVRWDGFRKKSILSPRNSLAAHSPVTVKIARPDHSGPSLEHPSCAAVPKAPEDPCSRESVLKVLKDSRKREVDDADRNFTAEQRSKRRRNDSGGSAHSAFEPLLPNGAPLKLVPKPGSLKRGMISAAEESTFKRSRTSSISSASGAHAPGGTPGSNRNPIQSSYSSSVGLAQFKKLSAQSSPMSSPGSSRSQTPDRTAKRPREDDGLSPGPASSPPSERAASDKVLDAPKQSPVPKVQVTSSINFASSGGKRKRRIQLVSSKRDDHISLPPPPELGYTITVKDLDEEKAAAMSKIQKILEPPVAEPQKSSSPSLTSIAPASLTTSAPMSASVISGTLTLSSLLAAPLPKACSTAPSVIAPDPEPSPALSNPLLEALKMKSPTSCASTAGATTVSTLTSPVPPGVSSLKVQPVADALKPWPVSQSHPAHSSVDQTSAFTQVPGQVSKATSGAPSLPPAGPLTSSSQLGGVPAACSAPKPPMVTTPMLSHSNPLPASGFKPIFAIATSAPLIVTSLESKPTLQNFNPSFGSSSARASFATAATSTTVSGTAGATIAPPSCATSATTSGAVSLTCSLFGSSTSSTVASSLFPEVASTAAATSGSTSSAPPAAQPSTKSIFGTWSAPPSMTASATSAPASTPGFQFGAGASTTPVAAIPAPTSTSAFTFGAAQPTSQVAGQKVFAFGQATVSQNTSTASFGGLAMATAAPASAANGGAAGPTTQPTFTFGKTSFQASGPQSSFGSTLVAPKPLTFGGGPAAPASNAMPFNFGAPATSAAVPSAFVTPSKPAFGGASTAFAFGQAAQTPSASSFTFGGGGPQQTPSSPAPPPASGGFNFGATISQPQFGTPVANKMGGFNFGAAGTCTPNFRQSPATATGPIPFGNASAPVQAFNAAPFGSQATPSFSIGAGSKPSGVRQRLQARRQHNRKK